MSTKKPSIQSLQETWEKDYFPSKYPDFRFFCPFCGAVEVFFELNKKYSSPIGRCLDCKQEWFDNENGDC